MSNPRGISAWSDRRRLRAQGVPASEVADPNRLLQTHPQLRARSWFETPEHPVVGPMPLPALPFREPGRERWLRSPAPTLGQHTHEVLGELLGLGADELGELEAEGVIGTRPRNL